MSQQTNNIFFAVLVILIILIGTVIFSVLFNNNNNCQQIDQNKKKKRTRSRRRNNEVENSDDNSGICITSKIFNCTNICDNSITSDDKDQMLASLMLSTDNTMITYTVNYVNNQLPPKLSQLQKVTFSVKNEDSFKIVKTVTNVQDTENGFIINGMWAKDDDSDVLTDEIVAGLQSSNMYIVLYFDNKVVSGPLLAIENAGQSVSRNYK